MINGKNAAGLADVLLTAIENYEQEITYLEIFSALERVKSRITDKMCESTTIPDVKY